jgi:hypothetical protein
MAAVRCDTPRPSSFAGSEKSYRYSAVQHLLLSSKINMDALSRTYHALLVGTYGCPNRIVVNAYFRMGHDAGGCRDFP